MTAPLLTISDVLAPLTAADLEPLLEEIRALRSAIEAIAPADREAYTIAEVAKLTGWSAYTLRGWCADGRIKADHDDRRRDAWSIPADELKRIPRKTRRANAPARR